MVNVLFSSPGGYGLGQRRSSLVAAALLAADPTNRVTVLPGAGHRPGTRFEEALRDRALAFHAAVARTRPDVVVVDRHPFGADGELLLGLMLAKDQGARLVLGLRDVLDDPAAVRAELAGEGWRDVTRFFDEAIVYGERSLCDHQREYGLPLPSTYVGWVATPSGPARPTRAQLVISADGGGDGDGDAVYRLGLHAVRLRPEWQACVVTGPYAANLPTALVRDRRISVVRNAVDCGDELSRASASLQTAGYDATVQAVAAGIRPILVPRRTPRGDQAIRALRLGALGLADSVDEQADPSEVAWLLDRSRLLRPGAAAEAGIRLDGAARAAAHLQAAVPRTLARARTRSLVAVP